ncbi:pheromone autoinducer 2 transporter [Alloiococcus otitis]|uniref:AI-2E family transporter n=1 Tax=Alloiococcus otitis ATCC 51267 TaxID=883081 RepID=K9EBV5_9LACT|nr:AI-2E family transporter [Alloiococcus otitis]EKU93301.1 hypothetical protein HMPREF9698_01049 [Alloiococcus otitis ATCC 51267]SUU81518.1 pheromone autoinducer 2 transporter [Alloiococcus otitis]
MKFSLSQFRKNHKFIFFLLVSFLVLLNLFLLLQMRPFLSPILQALQIVSAPLIASVIAYYVFKPFVDFMNKKGVPRAASVIIVFLAILALIGGAIVFIVPIINNQVEAIIQEFPSYWQQAVNFFEEEIGADFVAQILETVSQTNILENAANQFQTVLSATLGGIGSVISVTAQVVITIFTVPFILYFMLVDGSKIARGLVKVTPTQMKSTVRKFLSNVNLQLGTYVRGQIFVAICVAIIFLIGYAIIGLNYFLVLAIIAGFFNLVPYLGSFISGLLAAAVALFQDPILLVYLAILFIIEQILENRVIQPYILGSQLNIHPITILFILLIAGSLFGVLGLLLGVPAYAIIKIVVSMAFEYVKEETDLYHEDQGHASQAAVLKDQD